MVSVTVSGDTFIFEIKGFHKIWAMESKITISKENIIRAYQNKNEFTFWRGFRIPGTEIPGIITAGTFYKKGRNFWDVMNKKNALIVELKDNYYKKLIIEVENPEETMRVLNTK
ncbi:hypothetical protein ACM55H_08795 [Flavobacterium sp. ZT3R17]|uniref:hypothetical protein n=1 Tax=Flavobacterium cryoconiti TaxID=3398736 RepID=UPI003A8A9F44